MAKLLPLNSYSLTLQIKRHDGELPLIRCHNVTFSFYNAISLQFFVFLSLRLHGFSFKGSNSTSFAFTSHLNWSQLLNERICSHWSKFFPLKKTHY